jgi:hypothetical protein
MDYVFGYGSLVNELTHGYSEIHPARITGWRRKWCHAEGRRWAFLAAVPVPGAVLDGVIAHVPHEEWEALDQREFSYERTETAWVDHPLPHPVRVQHYWVPEGKHRPPDADEPVLLSYLDTCIEGFMEVFGETGPARFFDTTDGWEAPILDDRAAPIYRRHTAPGPSVQAITDAAIERVGARRIPLSAMVKELE